MKFLIVRPDENTWDQIANRCQYATFFHTRCWMDIITQTFPSFENLTIGWEMEDGRKAILPLVKTPVGPGGIFGKLHSMWPGVYGNILCDSKFSYAELDLLYRSIQSTWSTRMAAGGYIFGNPFNGQQLPDAWKTKRLITHIIDLREGVDSAWRRMESAFRRRVRRGREKGAIVTPANSLRDYQDYYEIYRDSQRRWGKKATSSYPYKLFENVYNAAVQNPDSIRLWLARVDGVLGAGALVFYHRQHAVSWHAVTLEALFHASLANVLQMGIIEDACERGFTWYDLNPSGGHVGTARFKQGMGAVEQPFNMAILKSSVLWKIYRQTKSVIFR